jgi:hypothetical protein
MPASTPSLMDNCRVRPRRRGNREVKSIHWIADLLPCQAVHPGKQIVAQHDGALTT